MSEENRVDPKADATRDDDLRESTRRAEEVREGSDPEASSRAKGAEEAAETAATGAEPEAVPPLSEDDEASPQTELEILRGELAAAQERVAEAERRAEEAEERALRARAELDTVRRRASGERERARTAGVDSAVAPALSVFDDLRRALAAAESGDPEQIVPGVRAVMEGLERNLAKLDIHRVGEVGQPFDHDLHEALTTVPASSPKLAGTIAEVFEAGFRQGDRLVRPARVVVYQEGDD